MHEYEEEQNKDKANDKAALDKLHQRMERHDMEVDLITKYSPFTNEEDLLGETITFFRKFLRYFSRI